MSDAYFVGVWRRFVLHRGRGRAVGNAADAGISLVEILVAIILLSVALIGTAGEIAAYIKQQVVERSQITANHLADSWFEYAESLEHGATSESGDGGAVTTSITPISTTTTTTTKQSNGVTYVETMTPHICSPSQLDASNFTLSKCVGNTVSPVNTIYSTITIKWTLGGSSHQLTQTRNLADNTTFKPANTPSASDNGLSNCTRAGTVTSSLSITSPQTTTKHTVTPASIGPAYLNGAGNPAEDGNGAAFSSVTLTLTEHGLVNTTDTTQTFFGAATCVPLLWTDSTGTHQVDMHTSDCEATGTVTPANYTSATCTYTASVPASSITETGLTSPWDATVPFCAYVLAPTPPATSTCTTTTANSGVVAVAPLNVAASPVLTCTPYPGMTVSATGILGVKDAVTAPVTEKCTALNLATTDTIQVSAVNTTVANLVWVPKNNDYEGPIPNRTVVTTPSTCALALCNVTLTFSTTRALDGVTSSLLNPLVVTGGLVSLGTFVVVGSL